MKISKLVSDLGYKEIKERKWRRCRIFRNGKEIVFLEFVVSDKGEVMRILSPKKKGKAYLGRICNLGSCWDYLFGTFVKDGKRYLIRIHKLVIESFIGKCPKGKEVNHKDGIKHHNDLENLEYVTKSENTKHAYRLGLQPKSGLAVFKGEDCPRAKLSQKEVDKMRKLWRSRKFTQKELGTKFNVSRGHVSNIVNWHYFSKK